MSDEGRNHEELIRILGLVERGELSVEEADELLAALAGAAGAAGGGEAEAPSGTPQPPAGAAAGPATDRPSGHRADYWSPADWGGRGELSLELRRLQREARRIAHDARRIARHELRDALREAKHEIEHGISLGIRESARAVEEVKAELKAVFGEARHPRGDKPRWLANLTGLDLQRDRIKHTSSVVLGREVETAERVSIHNSNGDVVVQCWERPRVEVHADKTAWGVDREVAQDRSEALPVEIQRRNGEMLVDARGPVPAGIGLLNLQRMRTDLIVSVPAGLPLEVNTKSGDVKVTGHAAELAVETTSGDVNISGSGFRVKAQTVSGDLDLSTTGAVALELATLSGDQTIRLRPLPGGEYRLRSSQGDIRAMVDPDTALGCEVETATGEIAIRPPFEVKARERRKVFAEAPPTQPQRQQEDAAQLVVTTLSGDVQISGWER
jgi:DUF4097 and DUF4098 domain-containing protein YvlB